jgi:hypothetical protein
MQNEVYDSYTQQVNDGECEMPARHIQVIHLCATILCFLLFFEAGGQAYGQFFRIASSTPRNNAKDVPLDTPIIIHFNYSVNRNTISTKVLSEGGTSSFLPVSLLYSNNDEELAIVPGARLKPGTTYVINLQDSQATSSSILDPWASIITFTTKGGHFSAVSYVSPDELTISPGGYSEVTYCFIEKGGGLAEIVQSLLVFEDMSGRQVSKSVETVKFVIKDGQTTKQRMTIAIPGDVGNLMMGKTIMARRIFVGLDHEGNKVELRTGVKVAIPHPSSSKLMIKDIQIKVPEYGMVVPRDSIITLEAQIRATGSGDIHGSWNLDGQPTSFFVARTTGGDTAQVTAADKAFAQNDGKHRLTLQVISPEKKVSEEVLYIVSSTQMAAPLLLIPAQGASFSNARGAPPIFRWSLNPSAGGYKIALGKAKDLKNAEWIRTETNSWIPTSVKWTSLGTGTFFWAVRPVLYNNQEGPASEAFTFTLTSSP